MPKDPVLYEAMYIVPTDMTDEEIAALEGRLRAGLEGEGAQVESTHEFARRRLAYPILGHTEGIYRIMYFRGNGAAVDELKHEMSLSAEIIRGSVVVANPRYMIGQQTAEQAPQSEAEAAGEQAAEPDEAERSAGVEDVSEAADDSAAVEEPRGDEAAVAEQ